MNGKSMYRIFGIFFCLILFVCLTVLIGTNVRKIASDHSAQEQNKERDEKKRQQEVQEVQEVQKVEEKTEREQERQRRDEAANVTIAPEQDSLTDNRAVSTPSPPEVPVATDEEWIDYHGSSLPIVFAYPQTWSVKETTGSFEGGLETGITLSKEDASLRTLRISGLTKSPLERIKKTEEKKYRLKEALQYNSIFLNESAEFKGRSSVTWEYEETENDGIKRHVYKLSFLQDGDIWEIRSVARADKYEELEPLFQRVIAGFDFSSVVGGAESM